MNYRKEIKLSEFITALTNSTSGLTAASFTSELTALVPWLVVMVPLSFGIRLVFRQIRKAQKGRA